MDEVSPALQFIDTLLQLATAASVAYTARMLRTVRKELREEVEAATEDREASSG